MKLNKMTFECRTDCEYPDGYNRKYRRQYSDRANSFPVSSSAVIAEHR